MLVKPVKNPTQKSLVNVGQQSNLALRSTVYGQPTSVALQSKVCGQPAHAVNSHVQLYRLVSTLQSILQSTSSISLILCWSSCWSKSLKLGHMCMKDEQRQQISPLLNFSSTRFNKLTMLMIYLLTCLSIYIEL